MVCGEGRIHEFKALKTPAATWPCFAFIPLFSDFDAAHLAIWSFHSSRRQWGGTNAPAKREFKVKTMLLDDLKRRSEVFIHSPRSLTVTAKHFPSNSAVSLAFVSAGTALLHPLTFVIFLKISRLGHGVFSTRRRRFPRLPENSWKMITESFCRSLPLRLMVLRWARKSILHMWV